MSLPFVCALLVFIRSMLRSKYLPSRLTVQYSDVRERMSTLLCSSGIHSSETRVHVLQKEYLLGAIRVARHCNEITTTNLNVLYNEKCENSST